MPCDEIDAVLSAIKSNPHPHLENFVFENYSKARKCSRFIPPLD